MTPAALPLLAGADVLGTGAVTPALRMTALALIVLLSALAVAGWESAIKSPPTSEEAESDETA